MKQIIAVIFLLGLLTFGACLDSSDDTPDNTVQQLIDDLQEIDDFLAENNIEAQSTPDSLLRFVITEEGTGVVPSNLVSNVEISFEAFLLDGVLVDQSEGNEEFTLNTQILGWQLGIPQVREGGTITLYVPSGLAFGAQETNTIPANSILIYEIDLIETTLTNQADETLLESELSVIDSILEARSISVVPSPDGLLRVLIDQDGSGAIPNVNSVINVDFEGRILETNELFDGGSGQNTQFPLNGLILGWQLGLPLIEEGGQITLFIPSVFAFRAQGTGSIPPNTIISFDITLNDVL